MENLEQQTKVISLGKMLVKELGLEPGVDTLSKWMAHYVAGKMTDVEQLAHGDGKEQAEKDCFEAILKLWDHRWSFPRQRQPFGNFAPILETLHKLNPESQLPHYFNSDDRDLMDKVLEGVKETEVEKYSRLCVQIDKTARIWIDFVLHLAALKAKNANTDDYIRNSADLSPNDDVQVILKTVGSDSKNSFEIYNGPDIMKGHKVNVLKRRLSELEQFSKLNELLTAHYKRELEDAERA
ncbi:MAG: hypothetical protein JST90_15985 [Bacteroidetes bacterium]|nr:hypothetical protein [Bacteroidota bacterium]